MSKSMRAVVLTAPGTMEVRDVPRPEAGPGQVLVRPRAVGLCGTDFHIWTGEANYHRDERGAPVPLDVAPQVLGHEITGTVEQVGTGVTDLAPGDRVVLDQGLNCHSYGRPEPCEYCRTGDSHQCAEFREHGISGLPGGLAEAIAVPAVNAIKMERELDWGESAVTEPLACVLHATDMLGAARTRYALAADEPDHRVRTALISGAGPSGLLWVQVLRRVCGFEGRLIVSEPDAGKRALAERFGAETVDPLKTSLVDEVAERTQGRRAELLVDASGIGSLFEEIPGLVRKQSTIVLYGHGHAGVGMEALNQVQWAEPNFLSPVGASGGFDADGRPTVYRRALRMLEEGQVDVAPLVTHRFDRLEAVPAAFDGAHRQAGYVKGVAVL